MSRKQLRSDLRFQEICESIPDDIAVLIVGDKYLKKQ